MNRNCVRIVVVAASVALLTPFVVAQLPQDPAANPGPASYPQSPQNMNQPVSPSSSATGAQTYPSSSSMRDTLGAPGETGQQMLDKQFVRSAVEGGIADVKLGTLATQKGGPGVKDLAQKMVDDHTALYKAMAEVADSLGVMLPKKMNKEGQAEYEKLNGLSGKDFDTEYLTFIVKAHWQNLHAFYMEASVASDPTLQTEVVKAMFAMHQHLGMINKTASDEGITLPPRPPRPGQTTMQKTTAQN
jgi:putative membrane protein